jgi:hypothetical protein
MLVHLINCGRIFRALTRAQRRILLTAGDGLVSGARRPIAALRLHGLVLDDEDRLSEAGAEIRIWNLPKDHPDRVAYIDSIKVDREEMSDVRTQ